MKKYIALVPFATTDKHLVLNGDVLYGELIEQKDDNYWYIELYNKNTRKYIGSKKVSSNRFQPESEAKKLLKKYLQEHNA